MSLHTILLILVVMAFLIGVPALAVWMIIELSSKKKRERRSGGGSVSAFVGGGLTELDRLLARPSVEHQIETENPVLEREDDKGGEL